MKITSLSQRTTGAVAAGLLVLAGTGVIAAENLPRASADETYPVTISASTAVLSMSVQINGASTCYGLNQEDGYVAMVNLAANEPITVVSYSSGGCTGTQLHSCTATLPENASSDRNGLYADTCGWGAGGG